MQSPVLRYEKVDGFGIKGHQQMHIRPIIFVIYLAKSRYQPCVVGDWNHAKLLEFVKFALRDRTPDAVPVPRHIVIAGAVHKDTDTILAAQTNQFSEGLRNRPRILQTDYDICVDQQLEICHRSMKSYIPA